MGGMIEDMLIGTAMLLVVEGVLYAAFPTQMKQFLALMRNMPERTMALSGLAAAALGMALYLLILLARGSI